VFSKDVRRSEVNPGRLAISRTDSAVTASIPIPNEFAAIWFNPPKEVLAAEVAVEMLTTHFRDVHAGVARTGIFHTNRIVYTCLPFVHYSPEMLM
jgi:hypothetical protein